MSAPPIPPVSFELDPTWPKKDHLFYLQAIADAGNFVADVQQLDLDRRDGQCFLTFGNRVTLDSFVSCGFRINGKSVSLSTAEHGTSVHVIDCPPHVSDSSLTAALSAFGVVNGAIRRGIIYFGSARV